MRCRPMGAVTLQRCDGFPLHPITLRLQNGLVDPTTDLDRRRVGTLSYAEKIRL
jgi:hypothetical protein